MASSDEIREKERRVREFMGSKGLKALLLKRQANFSWMTGGGLNLVGITTEMGVAALLITENSKFVVCSNIEAPRMVREERLEEQGYAVASFPWHEDSETASIKKLAGGGKIGCDAGFPGAEVLAEDIARLRYSLTPDEVERYRWLGERVSMGLEKTMMETRRGEKESEVVARLCGELWRDRIDPITLMSAADDRVSNFRHPIPTERKVEKYLMVSVNARKWGLIVSLTRFLHWRVHRLHRPGLSHEFPIPGHHPGKPRIHLEPIHHRDQIRGHDPHHPEGTGADHAPGFVPCLIGGGGGSVVCASRFA
jgi:Xaa-Pro dipeptidase